MIPRLVLEAVAITIVFTRGSIFKRVRESGPALWREFASCALCVGVWVGMGWRLLHARQHPLPLDLPLSTAEEVLASGATTGVCALIVYLFLSLLDRWS